jgi:hypothetical protein
MSDDDAVGDATQAIDSPHTEVVYAWQDEADEDQGDDTAARGAGGTATVAVAALSAVALVTAAVAAVVVLVAPTAPAGHYVIQPAPVEQAQSPPAPKTASKPAPQSQPKPPSHVAAALADLPSARQWTPQPAPAPKPPVVPLVAPSPEFDPARDQWLLDNLRSLGYMIFNPPLVIHNAHEFCRLLQQGESTRQADQQMAAQTGASTVDILQLTASAMLAYPNCY